MRTYTIVFENDVYFAYLNGATNAYYRHPNEQTVHDMMKFWGYSFKKDSK